MKSNETSSHEHALRRNTMQTAPMDMRQGRHSSYNVPLNMRLAGAPMHKLSPRSHANNKADEHARGEALFRSTPAKQSSAQEHARTRCTYANSAHANSSAKRPCKAPCVRDKWSSGARRNAHEHATGGALCDKRPHTTCLKCYEPIHAFGRHAL